MNALHGVGSDIYILQIIIQQQFDKSTKILHNNLILKTKFPVKIRDFQKVEKKELYQH